MPYDYTAEYPLGYTQARQRCSAQLLTIFDGQLSGYPNVDWRASDTLLGSLYLIFSITFVGIPSLLLALRSYSNQNNRARLYDALTHIADVPERLDITNLAMCHDALKSNFLSFDDLQQCPVESLHSILVPDFYRYVCEKTREVKIKKQEMSTALSRLKREQNTCEDGLRRAALNREINEIEQRLARCLTFMEEFAQAGYPRQILERLQREFRGPQPELIRQQPAFIEPRQATEHAGNMAARQRYLKKWQHASTNFDKLITKMDFRITVMNNQNLNQQDDTLINTATELRRILQEAKDAFAEQMDNPALSQRERVAASERFILICENAVRNASPILEKDKTYDWRYVLTDIANALVFIATLSLSYWVTGKFRLFTPLNQVESYAVTILHEAESALTRMRQSM